MNPSIEATPFYFLRLQRKLRVAVTASAIVILSFAITILVGYSIDSISLIRFPFSTTGMNPMVAFSFLLAGALLFFIGVIPHSHTTEILCKIIAWFFIIEGLARFLELGNIYDPRFDIILFNHRFLPNPESVIMGRMSYATAFVFILTGIAFHIRNDSDRRKMVFQGILLTIIILSIFNFLSILYGVSNTYFGPLLVFKMALSSSVCFFIVAFALLVENPGQGMMATITSEKPGGRLARLLLPVLLVFPLLGIVDSLTESVGIFQGALGLALVSVVAMVLFFVVIIRTARSNNTLYDQLEGEVEIRKKAVEEAYQADLFASVIYDNIPNMVFVKDGDSLLFKSLNKAGEEMIGMAREEVFDKSDYDFFPPSEADFFKARDREVFLTNKPVISEEQITTNEKGKRWLRTKKIGVRDDKGRPLYMIGISEDITELKEKEERLSRYQAELEEKVKERTQELRKSEKKFHAIIQSAPDAMIIADQNEIIHLVNTQTEKMFGYTRGEMIGKPITFLIPDQITMQNSGSEKQELFGKSKDGHDIPVEISLSPIETSEGILISVCIRDITQRKQAQKILIENELMFRDLTQNVPGVIYQWVERLDGSYGFKYVSPKLKQYFNVEPENMHTLAAFIHPDDKERWRLSIEEANASETPWFFEGRLLYPDGEVKWWRGTSVLSLKNEEGRVYNGIMMDITEKKLIEEKINSNKKRFEAIFNSQYQFLGVMAPDGTLLDANETALNFAGLSSTQVIGKPFWECYWWAIAERSQQKLKTSVTRAAAGEFIRYEADILGKGGIIATIDFSIKPVFDDAGNVILLIAEGRDVTQRKLLEQKAREQEEQIRLFVKHTPAAVAMFDTDMCYMVASDRWHRDYGLEGTNIIGSCHYDIFPEINNMPEWRKIHKHCLQGNVEIREKDAFPRADGSIDWLRWEIHPWRTNNNKIGGIILFTEVITEKIKVQDDLKHLNTQLTESNRELEQFAYVASHDLQEPLRMVSSFLQLLEKKYKDKLDDAAKQYIHFAVDGSERMKVLINDLLKFSRVGTAADEHVKVDCNDVVANLIKVYDQKINETGTSINVTALPVITGNKTQIEQLFQNLIGNALKYQGKESPKIEISCVEEDKKWKFYVKDNGIGIEPRFFEKVFVIFQRLHGKNEYSGTGIGLAICKKIVERHGGKIWIESQVGKGATFYFTVPI